MLALPAPYGYPDGQRISIRYDGPEWPSAIQAERMAGMCMGYGCPPFVADRVRDAIYASGRYDCAVTVSETVLRNFICAADMIGFTVTLRGK